jgi:HEAT repeat protein
MAVELTQAILQQQPYASDMAASMGKSALPELAQLLKHDDIKVRIDTILAMSKLDISHSYEQIFASLEDTDINVVQTSLAIVEKNKDKLSTQLLLGLLQKLTQPSAKARVILMLGETLKLDESNALEQYCTIEHGESLALHAIVALAKIGVEHRRQQFSAYLLSIKNNPALLSQLFTFVEYINQSWLLPSLRQMLSNKSYLHSLSCKLPNIPQSVRVCDQAVLSINLIAAQSFSFTVNGFTNFTDSQLREVNNATGQIRH